MFIKNILKHCQPAKLGVFRVFRAFRDKNKYQCENKVILSKKQKK